MTELIATEGPPPVGVDDASEPEPASGRLSRLFGPLTGGRVVALLAAFVFLAGAVGFAAGHRLASRDPLSAVDVGFLRDMNYHHEQAVQMSLILMAKPGIQSDVWSYASGVLVDQRYESGVMAATLDRFGASTEVGPTVMGWMGPPFAPDQMPGLASAAEMAQLKAARGPAAEALWIALMSRHHLGGVHMADFEARRGHDVRTRNLALAMAKNQRSEIIDFDAVRRRLGLPIPKGFSDPTKDPGLAPLSLTGS